MAIDFAGIWMDTKKAVFITLGKDFQNIKEIESSINTRERIPGESKNFGRFGNQFTNSESAKVEKRKQQTKSYIKEIIDHIKTGDFDFVVFGPANMKNEFEKELQQSYSELNTRYLGAHTADNMTQNQMAAWVRDYYKSIDLTTAS